MLVSDLEKLRLENMAVAPPRPKGPPLNALRAFEAAGRLESFALAGDELSVTPGAISQHIKALEGWVGAPLFQRNAQGVTLTDTGRALLPQFTNAFDHLGDATRSLRSIAPQAEIHIATMPALAQLWLPKRLAKIRAAFPQIKLSVTALETPPNLSRELFDLSIFFREPTDAEGEEILAQDIIYPVCSPQRARELSEPRALETQPILIDNAWDQDWDIWINASSQTLTQPKDKTTYSLYSLALEEAKAGVGILIGHDCLVESALAEGSLVRPFREFARTERALVLERPEKGRDPIIDGIAALLSEDDL